MEFTFKQHKNSSSINTFKQELNRDLPKIPKYYFCGNRKAQILHTRLRLGCSSLNSDLLKKNYVSNTDRCTCGSPETALHFLLKCNNYIDIRNDTINSLYIAFDIASWRAVLFTVMTSMNRYSLRSKLSLYRAIGLVESPSNTIYSYGSITVTTSSIQLQYLDIYIHILSYFHFHFFS